MSGPALIEAWSEDDPWPGGCAELLLVGPPGTGKTHNVLTRYVWPAIEGGAVVLATSYTRAAAEELRKRTAKHMNMAPAVFREELTTIHSEAHRRVRALNLEIGDDTDTDTADEDAAPKRGDPHLVEMAARLEEGAGRGPMAKWDRTRNLYPRDVHLPVRERLARVGLYGHDLDTAEAAVRHDLHARMRDGRMVRPDFTGLLELALTDGERRDVDLLCVDEAQDLSPLQWALLDRWATRARKILIVGDPDQSIYGYAGADGRRLLAWIRAGRPTRRLSRSYRVPRLVHALARRIITTVRDREDAPYAPKPVDGSVVSTSPGGAWDLVSAAQDAERGVFILSRTRKGVAAAVGELEARGVPCIAERGGCALGRQDAPSVGASVALALAALDRGVSVDPTAAKRLVRALDTKGPVMEGRRGVKSALTAHLRGVKASVRVDDLADVGLPVDDLVAGWRRDDLAWLEQTLLPQVVSAVDVLRVAKWSRIYGDSLYTVAAFVTLTTAHGSKGRERPVVVVDARATIGQRATSAEIDEDRRVLYVAVTRAEHDLVVVRGAREDWLSQHGITIR